jgi:arylsulfatase
MIPKQTRDGYPIRQGYGVLPGGADTYIGYGRGWANVSNTPFREYKHWEHEGGVSTPLIAHWPKGISSKQENQFITTPAHLIDIMATCVDLSGAKYPRELNGSRITPMEGISLKPAFSGQPLQRPQPIFFEHEGNRAVRDGKWKLVAKGPAGAWELYDMEADRTEMHDLITQQPALAKKMIKQWEDWANRAMVLPWNSTPAYGETAAAAPKGKGGKKKQ